MNLLSTIKLNPINLLFLLCIINSNHFYAQELSYQLPFRVITKICTDVYKVCDAGNKIFIVKKHSYKKRALYEIIGAEMGKNIVNINHVTILDTSIKNVDYGDLSADQLFTIHTYIEGEHPQKNNPLIQKAITNDIHLTYLTNHDPSLTRIAAFNLFINNIDCHNNNIFINKETNIFSLIDMDNAFNYIIDIIDMDNAFNYKRGYYLIAKETEKYLKKRKAQKTKFSSQEIATLKIFNQTLQQLITLYPPEKQYDLWHAKAKEFNVCKKQQLFTNIQEYFTIIKKVTKYINSLTKKSDFTTLLTAIVIWVILLGNLSF